MIDLSSDVWKSIITPIALLHLINRLSIKFGGLVLALKLLSRVNIPDHYPHSPKALASAWAFSVDL
jgi:hypothetical protein